MSKYLLPLGVFIIVAGFLFYGLSLNPREVPSPLVGKPAPAFQLPVLHTPEKAFTPEEMAGKVWLLNVWASWCVACRDEHPLMVELAKRKIVPPAGPCSSNRPPERFCVWPVPPSADARRDRPRTTTPTR